MSVGECLSGAPKNDLVVGINESNACVTTHVTTHIDKSNLVGGGTC